MRKRSSALDPSKPRKKAEGVFYVWTMDEIERILGTEHAAVFNFRFGVSENGNALHDLMGVFVGKNILHNAHTIEETARQFDKPVEEIRNMLDEVRWKLFSAREKRPHPHLDDKIITAWNGLMISAFARAYQVFGEDRFIKGATLAAEFVIANLYDRERNVLLRRYRDGEARFDGTLQDYAFLAMGLIDLYEASFKIRWLDEAINLTRRQIEIFRDDTNGGFYDTTGNDPSILVRTKEDYDGAEPTGNSIAALNLLRLAQMTDNNEWRSMAERTIRAFSGQLSQTPDALPQMLVALDWTLSTAKEIIIGRKEASDTKAMLREIRSRFIPHKVLLLVDDESRSTIESVLPFVKDMTMKDSKATAYVCRNHACSLPTNKPEVVAELLSESAKGT